MADDVTNIGDGWDGVPAGSAEDALRTIIEAGQLTGDAVAEQLSADGYADRGPVYYPVENGKGPFYALGKPHTYVSIEQGPNGRQWNLTRAEPGDLPVLAPPSSEPAPPPAPQNSLEVEQFMVALLNKLDGDSQNVIAEIKTARDEVIAAVRESQEAIQQQIDQVVKNAEATGKTLMPIVEAALPALSGLFSKK